MISAPSESRERALIGVLCLLGAVHVFVFSAAFPVFNNMDEIPHFDLVVKYAHGRLPCGIEPMGEESSLYTLTYDSPEYRQRPQSFPGGWYPTPGWTKPASAGEKAAWREAAFHQASASWRQIKGLPFWQNYESSQQPLYYALAGLWWRAGQTLGVAGLSLVYWVRFLNILLVVALVWVGYMAARTIFPENAFVRLGVPALIAFMPQQAFYSIQNDVLSPLCFGLAFICLVRWLRAEPPGPGLGIATGLSLAATFLAKMSNLPFLVVSALALLFKTWQLWKRGRLRTALPALVVLVFCAGLPIGGWLAWIKHAFGDFAGTAAKLQFITWTPKPFGEWWHHPIFTLRGLWTFLSELLVAFWQGEFRWHDNPLTLPVVDALYVVLSLAFLLLATVKLVPRFSVATPPQRQALGLGLGCCLAGTGFLAFLSIIYDFGICPNPSRDHPYFIAGRLILGALIPFLLLYLYGLDCWLRRAGNNWLRPVALVGMLLFILVSEIITDWSVFSSQYNWFHI